MFLYGAEKASAQDIQPRQHLESSAATAELAPAACKPKPGMLGVSRIVEIDTSAGARFGLQQYKENDFLKDGEVVLTFDDGPSRRNTRAVLEALASHCTRATFFMVGQMAASDPQMVREVARQGHTVGVHTWSHRNLKAIGPDRAKREFEMSVSAVQGALGARISPFFRFPYLADSGFMLNYLAERHFAVFSIDADSYDYRTRSASVMHNNIMRGLASRGKGILLFHDIQVSTGRGIKGVLDTLAQKGFKVVHLVAKQRATSVAAFDEAAQAELARRSRSTAMERRSIVYPISGGDVPIVHFQPQPAAHAPEAVSHGGRMASHVSSKRVHRASEPSHKPPRAPAGVSVRPVDANWPANVFNR
ncbi:MAG: polysaccharide deacetylase family protein [Hyphomicrobiaceae bacterium]